MGVAHISAGGKPKFSQRATFVLFCFFQSTFERTGFDYVRYTKIKEIFLKLVIKILL